MNRNSLATLVLVAPVATVAQAQATLLIQGGGELRIGTSTYRFKPELLAAAPAKGGLPRVFQLKGELIPGDPTQTLRFELTVLEDGRIWGLQLFRREGAHEVERWSPSLKTKVMVVELEPKLGGMLRLQLSGPMTGVDHRLVRNSSWSGELWGRFNVFP